MKAIVSERYGLPEVLEMRNVGAPDPGEADVVIQVMAASVNRSDWEFLTGRPLYARIGRRRLILGSDLAGRVVQVGAAVKSFRPGDEVFGDVMYDGGSAFAEFVCVPETAPIVHKPTALTFAQASAIPQAGIIALQSTSGIDVGDRVLINGAGGGAGSLAVQLAKGAGAEVTGVDNPLKHEFMLALGADHVVDYAGWDYTRSGDRYDLIIDMVSERSMLAIRRAVARGGRYTAVGGSVRAMLSSATVGRLLSTGGRSIGVLMARPTKDDLLRLVDLVAAGSLQIPIGRIFPLEGVPEALRLLGEDRALGKLVIEVC